MNFGTIFKRDNQNIRSGDAVKGGEPMPRGEHAYRVQREIRNLMPGQTIQGAVVSREGNSVQIALRQNMLINARIDQNISLTLGQSMSFEVKANNGSLLSLTPLYANMANEATVMRALDEAGMPETANNIEMVAVMMEEGMPIDRESLANISRLLMDFPTQDPATLIQMARLGIPVSEESIEQFERYLGAEHQLLGSAETVMNELPQVLSELTGEGKTDQAIALYLRILDIFTGGQENGADGTAVQKEGVQSMTPDGTVIVGEVRPDGQTIEPQASFVPSDAASVPAKEMTEEAPPDTVKPDVSQTGNTGEQQPLLTERQWSSLSDMLKELGINENTAKQIAGGEVPAREVLSLVRELIPKAGAGELHSRMMERLLGSRELETLLRDEVGKQWLIKPEDVADPHKVEQLYERIREQSARLHEALQMADKADTPMAKSVQNIQNNVDFMNQLNHMFTYIQLPLKMAGNNAHGDLYVYTNKKNLAAKDGNVSALLHLDMEHLGALDVYVTMQQNKVNTNFTFQDESALDLVEQHISELDERLARRGYELRSQFSVKEEQKENTIMQAMLGSGKNISLLSRTSFDMRA